MKPLSLRSFFRDRAGFTLIELMVVVAIMGIFALITVPKLSRIFSDKKESFALMTTIIVKTFDDAYLNNRTNYLVIHLDRGGHREDQELKDELSTDRNGVEVALYDKGKFIRHPRRIFNFRSFPGSFRFEEVLLASGERITDNYATIPFYPQGYSDNVIIHVLVNNEEQWSIRIYKHLKEPAIMAGYTTFSGKDHVGD